MRIMPNAARWAMVGGLSLLMSGCSAGYLLKQSVGQASLLLQRESMEAASKDERLSAEQRERLGLVAAAKAYAIKEIGLKHTGSYDQVVVLNRSAVTYVVSGAPKDALQPYLWHFPVVGAVPYKGFFDKADAEAEKKSLEDQGYDAYLRGVAAFSLLGWLPDPLYSSLLKYEPPILANIIIHELTHATVYLQGESSFNEGFATFVGNQGALGFLAQRYGANSSEVRYAQGSLRDEQRFNGFLSDLVNELRTMYREPYTTEEKLTRREAIFSAAKARFALLPMETDYFSGFAKTPLNNAYLMTQLTYQSNTDRFDRVYQRLGRDLPKFVRFFRDEVAKDPHPEQYLDRWLAT
ncbi:MAG TPA: aminopeptidase, partial [Stenomitos sp.]